MPKPFLYTAFLVNNPKAEAVAILLFISTLSEAKFTGEKLLSVASVNSNVLPATKTEEAVFFAERSHAGTVFVFDDYPKYDMDTILKIIVNEYGFMLLKQGKNKISLKRN